MVGMNPQGADVQIAILESQATFGIDFGAEIRVYNQNNKWFFGLVEDDKEERIVDPATSLGLDYTKKFVETIIQCICASAPMLPGEFKARMMAEANS